MAMRGEAPPLGRRDGLGSPEFAQLLAAFDPDPERAGAHYRELHERLVKFFEWQCAAAPDQLADQVLDRMTRHIAAGEHIQDLRAYAHGIAKLRLREAWREAAREEQVQSELRSASASVPPAAEQQDEAERQQECLDECLATLTPRNREIILSYYADERGRIEARRRLALRLGTDLNALRVRAHRIRTLLEECVWKCIG
jgi:DNA-directed RNA polymerase specialized sigma24 family protein